MGNGAFNGGSPLTDAKFWRVIAFALCAVLTTAFWRWVDAVEAQSEANAAAIDAHDDEPEHAAVKVLEGRIERIESDLKTTGDDVTVIRNWVERQTGREEGRRERRGE